MGIASSTSQSDNVYVTALLNQFSILLH